MTDQLMPNFRTTRFEAGYDMEAVDAFIARINEELSTLSGSLTAKDIEDVRFPAVRFEAGYSMDDVDDYLDSVAMPVVAGAHERAARRATRVQEREAEQGRERTEDRGPAERAEGGRPTERTPHERSAEKAPAAPSPVPAAGRTEESVVERAASTAASAAPAAAAGIAATAAATAAAAQQDSQPAAETSDGFRMPDLQAEFEKATETTGEDLEGEGPGSFELSSDPAGEDLKGVGPSDDAGPVRLFGD